LITYIHVKHNFTELKTPNINQTHTETQLLELHLNKTKLKIANIYIPPKVAINEIDNNRVTNCFKELLKNSPIITGDVNAHSTTWYSPYNDNRGTLIDEIINDSNNIIINDNTPTRLPIHTHLQQQQPTSPDITVIPIPLLAHTTWRTTHKLSSDHLPIIIEIQTKNTTHSTTRPRTYINYVKADWPGFTQHIENAIINTNIEDNIHKANTTLINAILHADKLYIPKGHIKHKTQLLPANITTLIHNRNKLRKENPQHRDLQQLSQTIHTNINLHKQQLWKQHIERDWSHKTNTHTYWQTIKHLQNKQQHIDTNRNLIFRNKVITNNTKIVNEFNKQFTSAIKRETDNTIRLTNRHLKTLDTVDINITAQETIIAIKNTKNSYTTGPDNISIHHLKHLGINAIELLTHIYNLAINTNIIPKFWKIAKTIPILKPNKDKNLGTSYRPIALLSPIAKTLEKILHKYIIASIPNITHQHGFKPNHSTTTALHTLNNIITTGFNKHKPPQRTITIALDMSKAFDTISHHLLIEKLIRIDNIPAKIIKFIANYMRGRKCYTVHNNHISSQRIAHCGVPQGGVLSPTLFNIYMADMPKPDTTKNLNLITYADDITLTATHTNIETAKTHIQKYLHDIAKWITDNKLQLNTNKTQTTLFTPDPAEYSMQLNLKLNNDTLKTEKNPKILGLILDPKLTYNSHIINTYNKSKQTLQVLKALTSTSWGKQKETIVNTYKTITRPIIEYSATVWGPIASSTNINKLQIIQNSALRLATGHTLDTNTTHIHNETKVLPLNTHIKLLSSQLRSKTQEIKHPLNKLFYNSPPKRLKKQTIFNNINYTTDLSLCPRQVASRLELKNNLKIIHTNNTQQHIQNIPNNNILNKKNPN
jgi:hypothetical protein